VGPEQVNGVDPFGGSSEIGDVALDDVDAFGRFRRIADENPDVDPGGP
jgi:hypothetical protein